MTPVDVDHLMREIEDDVRRARRKRLLARGAASEYRDPAVYAGVDAVLRRALEARDHEALLLPDFLSADHDWQLQTYLRFSSHRPVVGPLLVFFKRRILLPLTRWLYEYSLENFRRQQQINLLLFACVEELAIENALLRAGGAGRAGTDAAGGAGEAGTVGGTDDGAGGEAQAR